MNTTTTEAPKRPALRYHGGKWRQGPKIIAHFGEHRVYTESFGGGASVLLRKPRSHAEVYNDLDGEIVNLFRVIRDRGEELCHKLMLTPFAREEFDLSYERIEDCVEQARRTLFRSAAGFGGNLVSPTRGASPERTGFRSSSSRRISEQSGGSKCAAHDWMGGMDIEAARRTIVRAFFGTCNGAVTAKGTGFKANTTRNRAADWCGIAGNIAQVMARFSGVVIENRPAAKIMESHDGKDTLHYVDPPYPKETRDEGSDYRHEMTTECHIELASFLKTLKGMVVLSGYQCPLYARLFKDWKFIEQSSYADGAKPRTEILWFNQSAWNSRPQADLF